LGYVDVKKYQIGVCESLTAEIAIMNREAIALATDSAVTVRFRDNERINERIYTSATKIVALSKYRPVAVMVYGNAHFMGVPWETVIKRFRDELGTESFDELPDYASEFIKFLQFNNNIFKKPQEDHYAVQTIYSFFFYILKKIREQVKERTESVTNSELERSEIRNICKSVIEMQYKLWKQGSDVLNKRPRAFSVVKKRIYDIINRARKEVFEELPLSDDLNRKVINIAVWLFIKTRADLRSPDKSGLIVAGFGRKDIFPRLRSYFLQGRISSNLHISEGVSEDIGTLNDGSIIPFAQTDVVHTFMEGVNPQYQQLLDKNIEEILLKLPALIINQISQIDEKSKNRLLTNITGGLRNVAEEFRKKTTQLRHDQFVNPVTEIVRSLPKEELAEMAESLVNLTSLKRRLSSRESPTVGGPVDVAIISRGDGLIWIKRKHYFPSELNHHFFRNYYRRNYTDGQDQNTTN